MYIGFEDPLGVMKSLEVKAAFLPESNSTQVSIVLGVPPSDRTEVLFPVKVALLARGASWFEVGLKYKEWVEGSGAVWAFNERQVSGKIELEYEPDTLIRKI